MNNLRNSYGCRTSFREQSFKKLTSKTLSQNFLVSTFDSKPEITNVNKH